jgi:hypothetical protein
LYDDPSASKENKLLSLQRQRFYLGQVLSPDSPLPLLPTRIIENPPAPAGDVYSPNIRPLSGSSYPAFSTDVAEIQFGHVTIEYLKQLRPFGKWCTQCCSPYTSTGLGWSAEQAEEYMLHVEACWSVERYLFDRVIAVTINVPGIT